MMAAKRLYAWRGMQQHTSLASRGFASSAAIWEGENSFSSPKAHSTADLAAALRKRVAANSSGTENGRQRPQYGGSSRFQGSRGGARSGAVDRPQGNRREDSNSRPTYQRQAQRGGRDGGGGGQRGGRGREGGQRDGMNREGGQREGMSREAGQRGGRGREGGQRGGRGREGGQRGGRAGGLSRSRFGQGRFGQEESVSLPAPIQSIIPTTNWHAGGIPALQMYTRVPYARPAATLESLRQTSQGTENQGTSLKEAGDSLRLKLRSHGKVVLGHDHAPTLVARKGLSKGNALLSPQEREKGSIAEQAKEARVRLIQERFGGDYHRWEREALEATSPEAKADPSLRPAVQALLDNDDLGPITKAWTLDAVKKIVKGS